MRYKFNSRTILGISLLFSMFSIVCSSDKSADTSASLTTLEGEINNHTVVDLICNRKNSCLLAGQLTPYCLCLFNSGLLS